MTPEEAFSIAMNVYSEIPYSVEWASEPQLLLTGSEILKIAEIIIEMTK